MNERSNQMAILKGRITGICPRDEATNVLEIYDGSNYINCLSPKGYSASPGDIVSLRLEEHSVEKVVCGLEILTRAERRLPTRSELEYRGVDFKRKQPEVTMILDGSKQVFEYRGRVISFIRKFLESRGFIEVETPYLNIAPEISPVPDFVTERPRNFMPFHLRITNTEYMRRLMVAGFDEVYQIGKCFRDEKSSFKHHPEFTQLTFGVAYQNYNFLIDLTEELIHQAAEKIVGKTKFNFRGQEIDLTPPWRRMTMRESIEKFAGIDIEKYPSNEELSKRMEEMGMNPPHEFLFSGFLIRNALIDKLVEDFVVPHMVQPTFIKEYPYCLGGPAKEVEGKSGYKQRCEVFVGTMEIANYSTPQNDFKKVKMWYDETLQQKIESGWKNQFLDEGYLFAVSHGIQPCATGGFGIDRLLMLLLEKDDIKDVILFPEKA